MSDAWKAIREDTEEYERLCKRFNEEPQRDGVYDGHRKALGLRVKQKGERAFRSFRCTFR